MLFLLFLTTAVIIHGDIRVRSSVGQSARFTSVRSQVRALSRPPLHPHSGVLIGVSHPNGPPFTRSSLRATGTAQTGKMLLVAWAIHAGTLMSKVRLAGLCALTILITVVWLGHPFPARTQDPNAAVVYLPLVSNSIGNPSRIDHYTPQDLTTVAGIISCDAEVPRGRSVIHTAGLGNVGALPVTWSVGDFTGFYPAGNWSEMQRGLAPTFYGASAVQAGGTTIGLHLNSFSLATPDLYKVAQLVYAWPNHVFPWRYSGKASLCITYDAAIPNSWTGSGSINYAYTAIAISDERPALPFAQSSPAAGPPGPIPPIPSPVAGAAGLSRVLWIGLRPYDSRGAAMAIETPVWWAEQGTGIALGYYGGHRFSSLMPGPSSLRGGTWPGAAGHHRPGPGRPLRPGPLGQSGRLPAWTVQRWTRDVHHRGSTRPHVHEDQGRARIQPDRSMGLMAGQ
jgi:hypothetical protein